MCKECLLNTVIHRFRTNLMKLETVAKECKVMVACSGGASSVALLNLMNSFCKVDPSQQMRKPRFPVIICAHVDQSILFNNPELESSVRKLAEYESVPYFNVKIESIFKGKRAKMYKDRNGETVIAAGQDSNAQIFKDTLDSVSDYSSKEDLINIYTLKALEMEARKQGCNVILLGDNSTKLAIKVISDTAKGRGVSMASMVSLEQPGEIVVVKPLRDTLADEIAIFNQYKNLESYPHPNVTTGQSSSSSIERLTANFIMNVQKDFPSTVSTISRTAFKINSIVPTENEICAFCNG